MIVATFAFVLALLQAAAAPDSAPNLAPGPAATPTPAPDPGGAVAYFSGNWLCGNVTWSFTPLEPGSPWLRVNYRTATTSFGTAVFGYVPRLHAYVYRDFHADGGYADLAAKPPGGDKKWVFTGPFYQIDGSAPLNGYI